MAKFLTTDRIIALGLVLALLASIVMGANPELQTNVAVGLIGYLGRVVTGGSTPAATDNKEIIKEAVISEVLQQLTKKSQQPKG